METSTLLNLLDTEAQNRQATDAGLSGLLYSASAKIKALEAHAGPEQATTGRAVTLDDLANMKREIEAGRGPSIIGAGIGIPALRFS